jgi:hypothetical protein
LENRIKQLEDEKICISQASTARGDEKLPEAVQSDSKIGTVVRNTSHH